MLHLFCPATANSSLVFRPHAARSNPPFSFPHKTPGPPEPALRRIAYLLVKSYSNHRVPRPCQALQLPDASTRTAGKVKECSSLFRLATAWQPIILSAEAHSKLVRWAILPTNKTSSHTAIPTWSPAFRAAESVVTLLTPPNCSVAFHISTVPA